MLNVNNIALLSLAAGSAVAAPFRLHQRAAAGLNSAAVGAGKLYFGTAVDNNDLSDSEYKTLLANTADFGQITPANSMKWDAIEPSRDQFTYEQGDVIADLAKTNGQKLRCHNLVWYNQLPSWVSNGGFDNATLISILQNHIKNEVTHYKGQCIQWDVVNEAISDNGDGSLRSNVFLETIGEAYIPIAFAAAAAADPDVKLYYNDYSIENPGAKSTAAQDIVKLVQSYGVKIDGVGLQSHFIVGSTPSLDDQLANMKAFTDLGVDVAITELDIRTDQPNNPSAYETQQATDYETTIKACEQTERCVGVTLWDYTDKYSWVPNTFQGQGAALPWDDNYAKKPAYTSILDAWGPAKSNTTSPSTSAAASGTMPSSTASMSILPISVNATRPAAGPTGTAVLPVLPTTMAQAATSSVVSPAEATSGADGDCEVKYIYVKA